MSKVLSWALAVCALLFVLPAAAAVVEEGAPNLMVRPFEGPKAEALSERVVRVLEEQGADLVPAGFEGPTPLNTDEDYASVAARLNIRAYILGVSRNDTSGWELDLIVRQGSDGAIVGTTTFKASWFPGLLTKLDEELITALEGALSGAEVPEGAPPIEDEEEEEEEADDTEKEKKKLKPLELDAGMGFVFRDYAGNNVVSRPQVLSTLDQSGGMANLRIGAGFYPMALFSDGFLANIGIVGHFERSLGGQTQGGNNPNTPGVEEEAEQMTTTLSAYDIGVRARLPVGQHQFGLSAAYGVHAFEIDDGDLGQGGPEQNLVPDVEYSFIRVGGDFTYSLDTYHLTATVGLRVVNNAGDDEGYIQNDAWFPNSDVNGMDAGLMGSYDITDRLTASLGLDFRNFFFSMNNRVEDYGEENSGFTTGRRPIAGGARDMYLAGMLAVSYSIR